MLVSAKDSDRRADERVDSGKAKVAATREIGAMDRASEATQLMRDTQLFFSISDLAARWRVSRSAVYAYLRGYEVVDFAPAPGRKGHKLVSAETVLQIERERMRIMR